MKRYPKYKDSGVEWIGNIPDHWMRTKIKFLSRGDKKSFVDGDWIELPYITDDGIRLIQTGNVGIGEYREKGFKYIDENTLTELNCTEIFSNDILICRLAAPVGRACLVPNLEKRMITAVDNCILKTSESNDPRFVVYQLSTKHYLDYLEYISRGGTRGRISRSMLGDIEFVTPKFKEQQSIANYLDHKTDQIDTLIEKKQKQIEILKEQRTAIINHAVTKGLTKGLNPNVKMKDSGIEWLGEIPTNWEVSFLKRFCNKITDGSHFSPTTQDEGYPYVTVKDVDEDRIDFDNCKRIAEKDYLFLKKNGCQPKKFDILLTKDGTIGKAVVLKEDKPFVILSSLGLLTPNQDKFFPDFLRYYLISGINVDQMFSCF